MRALREDLVSSGWGVETVADLLGDAAAAALHREIRLPALRAVRAALAESRGAGTAPSPVAVLTALFMLGEPVAASELDAALPRTRTAGALAMGLVFPVGHDGCDEPGNTESRLPRLGSVPGPAAGASAVPSAGSEPAGAGVGVPAAPAASPAASAFDSEPPAAVRVVRAAVDLRPHETTDDAGEVRWWVASDLGELTTGRELAPDHVLGIGGAGLTLASLTPRAPVATAVDLGCGCGIQTLYLLRHAERVTATDISARALAFTAFNAALAGTEPDRLELIRGSLLEPLSGRAFDLIATNPPFVLTPPAVREAGLPLMEYRDAGAPVLPALVPAVGEHLSPGGIAVMLGNWEHRGTASWREVVAAWLPEGLDAWILERELQDPVEYATMWLRDGGMTPERDPEAFDAALEAWIDDFEARDVRGVGFGYLIVHRPRRPREPWRLLEEVTTSGQGVLGPHIAEVLEVRERLAGLDDDAVADLCPLLAPDVTEERHLIPGAAEPTVILLRQGGGLGRTLQASTAVAALAGVADGELSVGQVASAVAALSELNAADALALRAEMVEATRHLLTTGFLRPGK